MSASGDPQSCSAASGSLQALLGLRQQQPCWSGSCRLCADPVQPKEEIQARVTHAASGQPEKAEGRTFTARESALGLSRQQLPNNCLHTDCAHAPSVHAFAPIHCSRIDAYRKEQASSSTLVLAQQSRNRPLRAHCQLTRVPANLAAASSATTSH